MDRNNYHTYLFVGMCWLIPIVILSTVFGPIQWIFYWADTNDWNTNRRTLSFFGFFLLLIGIIVMLTRTTTRFLMNSNNVNALLHKILWAFLTLICIASLIWLFINPELFTAIGYN